MIALLIPPILTFLYKSLRRVEEWS
jgi:hypothetical protein